MKNVHVLPTDKPSRLYKNLLTDKLFILENSFMDVSECNREYQNIYITNSEEIKEGDWFIHSSHGTTTLLKCKFVNSKDIMDNEGKTCWVEYSRKIILTTDSDLIVNGVQSIDDSFL